MESSKNKSVRLRWAKVEPCVEGIVHLITSLDDSIPLHWSDTEGLYESAPTKVPLGTHNCTLAVGGDIIPVDEFDVHENSDTIYIILTEEEIPEQIEEGSQGSIIDDDDDPVADLLASASIAGSNDLGKEFPSTSGVERHDVIGDNLSPEDRKLPDTSSVMELSPLYKELLQHQVLHGEPSWVPKGDDQSPTISDRELDELMTRTGIEDGPPPHLTSQPANPQERHLKSPVPIRPISKEDSLPDTLLGRQGEGTKERGLETGDVKGADDHHGNDSPAGSSSTYSGHDSEPSSTRNSPDISDGANDSDVSDALQEQSLEEGIPRDSPEIQELPRPYDGTFLTRDIIDENSRQEKKTSSPIPLGFTSNQSSTRASPHGETRGSSVPGSRSSPVTSDHSVERIPSTSGAQDSTNPSITSLPDPGTLQGSLRLMDEKRKGSPASGGDRTPLDSSPEGSTHSSVRKRSVEDVGSPPQSGRASAHSSTRSSRGQSPIVPVGPLPGQGTIHPGSTSQTAFRTSTAAPINSSTRSSRGQSPIAPVGTLPGQGTTHAGITSQTTISTSPAGSIPSSRRSSHGQSPIAPVSSLPGQGTIYPGITSQTTISTSPAGSIPSSTRSSRGQSPIAPVGSLPGQGTTHPGITSQTVFSTSPAGSIPSSTRSSRGQSPIAPVGSLSGQGTTHPGITSQTAISTSPTGSIPSSTRSSRGQSLIAPVGSLPGHGTMRDPGTTSPTAISSLHSSARSTPRGSSPARRSPSIPKDDEYDILSRHSRESSTFLRGIVKSPSSYFSSRQPVDSFLNRHDTNPAFAHELPGSLSPRSSVHSRVSPGLSHWSREGNGISFQRSLIDSFEDIRDRGAMFTQGPSRDQRSRSSERRRDAGHRRPEGKDEGVFPGHFIPSSSSAFAPMNGDRTKLDVNHNEEREAILEQERLFQEKQIEFEGEIRRLREVNEDLKQQLLSVEAAVALSERDNQRSHGLEATVASLNDTVKEKDNEIAQLKKRCEELEKSNQEMKGEQESLKTVNKLTYDDLNKENLDLRAKINAMQRKSYGSPMRTYTSSSDEIRNKMLREKVIQLEADKRELKQKYNKTKLELDQTKAEKILSDSRLKKARSETDLSETLKKYTTYSKPGQDKDIYDQSWAKTSSGLGSSRYSWSDINFDSAYKVGHGTSQESSFTNGQWTRDIYSSRDGHVTEKPLYSTSHEGRRHSSIDDDIDVISDTLEQDLDHRSTHAHDRHRTLSSESSNSSLLEYEYGANIRVPYQPSTYSSRDTKVELRETGRGRRVRPHSFHADTVLASDRQEVNGDINHYRSLSHSPSRTKDYGSTYHTLDYGTSSRPVDFEYKFRNRDYGSLPNGYGTKSTVNTPYSTTAGYPRASSQPFCPTVSKDIELGMRVMVTRNTGSCGNGVVKYVGTLPGRDGPYVGVDLDSGDGRHDGSFQGRRLFKCKPNRGIFVKLSKVLMCYPK